MTLIRPARVEEIEAIRSLFVEEVRAGRMLPRTIEEIHTHLHDWLVAEASDGRIIGCVSLVIFTPALCEVRSLAVHTSHRGNGLAGKLIAGAVEMARLRGMQQALTLTRAVRVFERAGFRRDYVTNYPEKVWRDCAPCPLRAMCDETALIYQL